MCDASSTLKELIPTCPDFSVMSLLSAMILAVHPILVRYIGQYCHFSLGHRQFLRTTATSQIQSAFSEWKVEITEFTFHLLL
jgi:hypothetical protein